MTNKSGAIGSWTERGIVLYLRPNGFGGADGVGRAERIVLNGIHDEGDIGVCPGVMIQSKGGHAAEQASDALIAEWLEATEKQRQARGADVAALVTKRKGKGRASAGQWWEHRTGWAYVYLAASRNYPGIGSTRYTRQFADLPAVRMPLAALVDLLRAAGYGDPLDPSRKDTTT
jgi:hypothetical protein